MPRIPLVSEASMTDAQRRVYDAMMSGPRRSPPVGPAGRQGDYQIE
jgi:hypothetical protein